MKKAVLTLGALAILFTAGTKANIQWDYIGAGYTDAAGDGPYIEASLRLDNTWVADATLSRLSSGPVDINLLQAGVNYRSDFKLDFSPATQTYLLAGVDHAFGDADDTGVYGGVGLRHPLTPQVELYSEATYRTIGDNYGSLAGGIAYYLSPDWAVRGNIALNSGNARNEFRFGVSYQF